MIDFAEHNLHVVSYSVPVRRADDLAELREHLHTLPEPPGAGSPTARPTTTRALGLLPVRSEQLDALPDGEYEVCIDSTLERRAPDLRRVRAARRAATDEVLISCHVCHPSLANDNLSGIAVARLRLARALARPPAATPTASCSCPGTIGSITWLARNDEAAARGSATAWC